MVLDCRIKDACKPLLTCNWSGKSNTLCEKRSMEIVSTLKWYNHTGWYSSTHWKCQIKGNSMQTVESYKSLSVRMRLFEVTTFQPDWPSCDHHALQPDAERSVAWNWEGDGQQKLEWIRAGKCGRGGGVKFLGTVRYLRGEYFCLATWTAGVVSVCWWNKREEMKVGQRKI